MSRYPDLLSAAERHRGLVTRGELSDLGVSDSTVGRMIRRGALRIVHAHRVYALGSVPLDFETRALAASLAIPDGWLSGVTAGRLATLRGTPRDRVELTVVSTSRPRLAGVRVRRTNLPEPDVVDHLDGMRTSSIAQCLFELSYELDDLALSSALEDALERDLVTPQGLAVVGERALRMGRNGSERYRRVVLARPIDLPAVMSRDELVLLQALETAGLRLERQHPLLLPDGRTIHLDGALPEIRFGLEVDGPEHELPAQVQRDKHRDLRAATINWLVVRPTTEDVRRRLGLTVRNVLDCVEARRRLFGQVA